MSTDHGVADQRAREAVEKLRERGDELYRKCPCGLCRECEDGDLMLTAVALLTDQPRPKVEASCDLRVGKCRGHQLGHADQWVPEPGSRAALVPQSAEPSPEMVMVRDAAQFLCDRLDDLELIDGGEQETYRQYMGHVDPAHHRLKHALAASPQGPTGEPSREEG